jgi:hypothetical protein
VDLYIHSIICLHGIVLNYLTTGTNLSLFYPVLNTPPLIHSSPNPHALTSVMRIFVARFVQFVTNQPICTGSINNDLIQAENCTRFLAPFKKCSRILISIRLVVRLFICNRARYVLLIYPPQSSGPQLKTRKNININREYDYLHSCCLLSRSAAVSSLESEMQKRNR